MQALGSSLTVKGTAARGQDGRPSVQAVATSDKIDLDALLAALAKPPASRGRCSRAAAPPAPTAKPAASGRLIPDTPIPFDLLRLADADVKLSVAQLVVGGAIYRAIATHIDLHGGRLRLDPLTADLPEGHLNAALSADATQAPPAVALRLQIPALALQPLLAAMKEPGVITGNMQVQADLHGSGATPHAIAASHRWFARPRDGQRHRGQPPPGRHARIDPAPGQSARSGRPRRHQPDPVLRRAPRRRARDRHGALARAGLVAAHDGRERKPQPWRRDARSARSAAGEGCRHRSRRADANQRAVPIAGRRARRRRRRSPRMPEPWQVPCWATRPRWGWPPARWARSNCSAARRSTAVRPSRVPAARRAPRRRPPRLRSPHRNSSQSLRTSVAC